MTRNNKILMQDELASIENEAEKLEYLVLGLNSDFSKQDMEATEKAWLIDTKTKTLDIIADYSYKVIKKLIDLQEKIGNIQELETASDTMRQ